MAVDPIEFELVSPERLLVSRPVEMVTIPGAEGDFGVMIQHIPLVATLRPGVIRIHQGEAVTDRIFVAGGFAEVTGERVTVLAEEAMPVDSITADQARARIKAAEDELTAAATDEQNRAHALTNLAIAEAMLAAVEDRPAH